MNCLLIVGRFLKKLDVFSTTEFLRLMSRSNGELMTFKAKTQFNLDTLTLNTSSFSKEKFMLAVGVRDSIYQFNADHFHMELRTTSFFENDNRNRYYT